MGKNQTRWRYANGIVYRIKNQGGKISGGIEYRDEEGNRKQKIVRGAQSRKDAVLALESIVSEVFNRRYGIKPKRKSITFQRFAVMYLEDYSKVAKESSETDEHRFKSLKKHFVDVELREITPLMIERYRSSRRKKLISKSTINREVTLLKHMFKVAIDEGYLEKNPARKIKMYSEADTIRDRVLEREEQPRLFAKLVERVESFILAALHTGMRKSELHKLEWRNVVLKGKNSSYVKVEKIKSRKAREIPINTILFDVLTKLKANSGKSKLVFPFKSVRPAFTNACKKAGIEDFTFQDLRRTFGTRLLENGCDIVTISRLYGHSSVLVTQRYLHPKDTLSRDAVESLVGDGEMLEICETEKETEIPSTTVIH